MQLSGTKALVTGAGGYIGSHLVELLVQEGVKVRGATHYNGRDHHGYLALLPKELRSQVEVFPLDVADPYLVRKAMEGCDVVFHLAALIGIPYSYLAPSSYVTTNVSGGINILQAAADLGVRRLVMTSTSEVYGSARYTPIDEAHPLQAQSPYAASKIGSDKLAESFYNSFKTPVVTLRPFNTYGPRQSQRAIIPTIISQLARGNEVHVGNLDPKRDFVYVRDTARAFAAVAGCDEAVGKVLNAATGLSISIGQLVEQIAHQLGYQDKNSYKVITDDQRKRSAGSEVDSLLGDATELKKLTGWTPEVGLEAGLKETIEFVRSHPSMYAEKGYVV